MSEFLYTIPYSSFDLWDVKRYSKITYTSRYSIEPLGRHIRSEIEKINLPDFPEETFSILGISNEIGMHDAYDKKGKEFNQPYKIVKDGFIAYNPYRVNVGSIGIKTPASKGNLISPAYVVFSCRKTILPEFLFLLMKTNMFNKQVKENTSGSVRQNLTYDALASIKIPVPSLSEQKEIVENYYTMIRQANDIIELSWTKMDEYYISVLQAKNYRYNPLLQYTFGFVNFKKLTRWDSWATDTGLTSDKYDIVPFGQLVLGKPQYGANVKGVDVPCEYRYIRITDINEDGSLNNEIKYAQFSLRVEKLKIAFKTIYGILDKIAYFLNVYYDLGIPERSVNYRSVWRDETNGKKHKNVLNIDENFALASLYWICQDFDETFGRDSNPELERLRNIRNFLEHKYTIVTWFYNNRKPLKEHAEALYISENELCDCTIELFKVVREAIICLSLCVNLEEEKKFDKISDETKIVNMTIQKFDDEFKF